MVSAFLGDHRRVSIWFLCQIDVFFFSSLVRDKFRVAQNVRIAGTKKTRKKHRREERKMICRTDAWYRCHLIMFDLTVWSACYRLHSIFHSATDLFSLLFAFYKLRILDSTPTKMMMLMMMVHRVHNKRPREMYSNFLRIGNNLWMHI